MKASLITIVDNVNFGTYLQAFATAQRIQERGCDVLVINYERSYISKNDLYKNYLGKESWSIIKKIIYILGTLTLESYIKFKLRRFLSSRVRLSKKCSTQKEILKIIKDSDILVTGSDQVWNTEHNKGLDRAFFWYNCQKQKFSYASSFGVTEISDNIKSEMQFLLSSYKGISVRETSGVRILHGMGIDNVEHVLDPTLLLGRDEWMHYSNSKFRKKEPYLLIYSVESNQNFLVKAQAKIIAKEKGLKIYAITAGVKSPREFDADKVFNLSGVDDFLNLFFHADFVIASSFHGTAFSINFNKEFITVASSRFNSRIHSLLQLTKLTDRFITDECKSSHNLVNIDFSIVNDILSKERKKSEAYLDRMLLFKK